MEKRFFLTTVDEGISTSFDGESRWNEKGGRQGDNCLACLEVVEWKKVGLYDPEIWPESSSYQQMGGV